MNCTYLRQAKDKYFCMKKSCGIDIKICDTCKLREHSGVKEFISTATEVIKTAVVTPKKPKRASKELREERRRRCGECQHLKGRRCGICKCFLDVKIQFQAVKCPKGVW